MTTEPPESGGMLCTHCAFPHATGVEFCQRCGAPLGMMATIDPFKQTLSEGFAYRHAVEGSPKLIVVIGMWVIFVPGLLGLPVAIVDRSSASNPLPVAVIYCLVSAVILYRTTTGYLRESRHRHDPAAEDHPPSPDPDTPLHPSSSG